MQDAQALLILETAYNLFESSRDAMRGIARAALRAIPDGPVAVARFDDCARLHPDSVHFEGADRDYVSRFFEWQRLASRTMRQNLRALPSHAINFHSSACRALSTELEALARGIFPLCVMANTGDGSGLYLMFGSRCVREWLPAQLHDFHELAQHLAVAWRIRKALKVSEPAANDAGLFDPPVASACEALRDAVLAQDRLRNGHGSVGQQLLWPELLAGRWSLLDAFTNAGMRYLIAYKNPEGATLRALHERERAVLELALAGHSGKWIAFELRLSESTVARTLRTALRRIGAVDTAPLVGVHNALFEPLEGVTPGVDLAIARLTPAATSAGLSDAERAVVTGILGGKRIAAIARERGTSPRTVSNQIASVYKKLGVSSRREVLALLT
jgi:DNA-binding NarL/FixJ family response regulator